MPCKHRFFDKLIPVNEGIEYLFIGTFNPEWDAKNGNNAEYFYGRATNQFWCILPHAFEKNCLIDKGDFEWKEFCKINKVGLTDIIREIPNADDSDSNHKDKLTKGFSDNSIETKDGKEYIFELDFNTQNIIDFIEKNVSTLKGVFFTRSTFKDVFRIEEEWKKVVSHCYLNKIYTSALSSPSSRGRGTVRGKISEWRSHIEIADLSFNNHS